jgi:hypothetical protein
MRRLPAPVHDARRVEAAAGDRNRFGTAVDLIGNADRRAAAGPRGSSPPCAPGPSAGTPWWRRRVAPPSIAEPPPRFAVTDVTVDGVTVPAGDAVVTTYAAAGLDPAHHGPDAAAYDAARGADDHPAPGSGCTGA